MSRIFLSHSSRDNREALALKQWLSAQRPELATEIFLDIDPASGLQTGARWKGQLFDSNSRCQTVICLLSRSWEASHECKTEYRTAEGLGKQIIVARLEDRGDTDITSEWQRCDLFADGAQTEIILCGRRHQKRGVETGGGLRYPGLGPPHRQMRGARHTRRQPRWCSGGLRGEHLRRRRVVPGARADAGGGLEHCDRAALHRPQPNQRCGS